MKNDQPIKDLALNQPTARARGTRLDRAWVPDPAFHRKSGWTDAEAAEVLEEFRDYWCAKPGAVACKLDWQATWRNWLRKEARSRRRGPAGWHDAPSTTTGRVQQALTLADKLDAADSKAGTLW